MTSPPCHPLVPVPFFHCRVHPQTSRPADGGAHFLKYHVLGPDTFTVLADREAVAGNQLFEDYGDNDNAM